jgi:bifunctional non-homologous end joining protein LigD
VLKSWAVAKGPSYAVREKRLAVQVEDHPLEYGGFEGIIPAGQYGGGTVMLWDQGTWEPQEGHTDVDAGLAAGSLKFILHGTKVKGKWALIRMGGKAAKSSKPNWLLIKEHDEWERPDGPAVTEAEPDSVITGRSLEQIAASEDHVWESQGTGRSGELSDALKGLPKEAQPGFVKPQLAMEAQHAPRGQGWLHELKLDGYRMQARKDGAKVQLFTRSGLDWTARMRGIAAVVGQLPVDAVTLDGEVVVVAADGTTNFADLQAAFQEGAKHALSYFCFDLLHLDGRSTRELPLSERKALLASVLAGGDGETLRVSEYLETDGQQMFEHACALHAEGIVSKRATSKYTSTRNGNWLKLKCLHEQEFVVGGFTLPSNGSHGIGALLLGYHEDGKLIYAGRTGTGFTQETHRMLRAKLDALVVAASPFGSLPAASRRGARWVRPELVAQVRFATWTAGKQLRQAAFLGLREDKTASEVVREEAAPAAKRGRSGAARQVAKQVAKDERAPVRLTHPAKVLDAESGLTKQMLANYYWAIADHLLPYVADRPLSLVRCPDGADKPCFYQKHVTSLLSQGVETVMVTDKKSGKPEPYITLNTREGLAGLAQAGVLEVHPWGAKNDDLEHPDWLVFDLDPDEALAWPTVAEAALEIRARLKRRQLESFVKTTGGKGLHVVVPILPQADWAAIKQFTRGFVVEMEKASPTLYVSKMTKAARAGRIYIDYLRNERGATSVAPYSPRARAGAPVSMPLAWRELKAVERPVFRVADFAQWRGRLRTDPWKGFFGVKQGLG